MISRLGDAAVAVAVAGAQYGEECTYPVGALVCMARPILPTLSFLHGLCELGS